MSILSWQAVVAAARVEVALVVSRRAPWLHQGRSPLWLALVVLTVLAGPEPVWWRLQGATLHSILLSHMEAALGLVQEMGPAARAGLAEVGDMTGSTSPAQVACLRKEMVVADLIGEAMALEAEVVAPAGLARMLRESITLVWAAPVSFPTSAVWLSGTEVVVVAASTPTMATMVTGSVVDGAMAARDSVVVVVGAAALAPEEVDIILMAKTVHQTLAVAVAALIRNRMWQAMAVLALSGSSMRAHKLMKVEPWNLAVATLFTLSPPLAPIS